MRARVLIPLYLFAVLLPLGLSWVFGGPPRMLHQELASAMGMLAFAMVLAEFVLSGRFKRVSNAVGMDVTMRFHQLTARTALFLALLHPLFYSGSPSGGVRPWDTTRQLTITTDFSDLISGIVAYLLLATLVLLGVGRRHLDYSYETWRLMHGIGALAIALLLLHHTLYAGRYAAQPEIMLLWILMTAIACSALVYVYLVAPLRDKARSWRVTDVSPLGPRQWHVSVAPDGHEGLSYKAGQFVWLNLGHNSFSLEEHPFSIASAPASGPEVSFIIKELGDFTRTVGAVAKGTRAYLDGPYGSLCVDGRGEPGVGLIAGGVGIAPLIGILRQLRRTKDTRAVKLIYGNRVEQQIVFREELEDEQTTFVLSEPPAGWTGEKGFIDPDLLDRQFATSEYSEWVFVLCGPSPMLDTVEEHLLQRGVPASRILLERFDYD